MPTHSPASPTSGLHQTNNPQNWWGNTLGPTALLVARHLALYAADGESEWPLDQLAGTYGVSVATIGRTLDRLARFGIVARHGATVAVRLIAGPLSQRQVERLPRYLAEARES